MVTTILHIEDDPNNRELVRKLLEHQGYEVVDAATGLEGIASAERVNPDLVLVDLQLPELDGYEVTLRLRGIAAMDGVPIVAITAEGDRETSLAVGADGFIQKPIAVGTFASQVARFLEGHRERGDEATGQVRLREQSHRIVEHLERRARELMESNRQLIDARRLRQEFLRNTTHELATPLTPIVGYLSLMEEERFGPLNSEQKSVVRSLQSSVERLKQVVDTMLDVSAMELGRFRVRGDVFDVVNMMKNIERAVSEEDRKRTTFSLPSSPIMLRGDEEKLTRALTHILDNAWKFSGPGVAVGVVCEELNGRIRILVADDGPGVPAEAHNQIFETFFQLDGSVTRKHGGVGLGLAYVRNVAQAMMGTLSFESPPRSEVAGRKYTGSLVIISFPA